MAASPPGLIRTPLPQAVCDRYLPLAEAGRGAGTRVYHAYDTVAGQDVALQLLRHGERRGPLERRFLRSAKAAMAISHPSVVRYHDVGETSDGQPYAVMELLRGETLGALLKRERRLEPQLAVRLFSQAADGLTAIHQAGLVHRDVKPDNLFLTGPPGNPEKLVVLDFGLAKRVASPPNYASRLVVGTTEYMPPEQIVCDPVDARSDVYSLGAVMFRALTGELPFSESPHLQLLAHHLISPAPPPSWLVEELPEGLQNIVLTALRKHPMNRYPTMAAMQDALAAVAAGTGQQVMPALMRDPDRYEPHLDHAHQALRKLGIALAA